MAHEAPSLRLVDPDETYDSEGVGVSEEFLVVLKELAGSARPLPVWTVVVRQWHALLLHAAAGMPALAEAAVDVPRVGRWPPMFLG